MRQEMSGFLDFFKKKPTPGLPAPEKKSLSPYTPSESKKPLIEYVFPKHVLPKKVKVEEKKKAVDPGKLAIFKTDIIKPKELKEQAEKEVKPPARYVFLEPSAPPVVYPPRSRRSVLPERKTLEWRIPYAREMAAHFAETLDLGSIFEEVQELRSTPEFKHDQISHAKRGLPMMIPLVEVTYMEPLIDLANFYGIPWAVVESYFPDERTLEEEEEANERFWHEVISPLNDRVTDAFEILKPPDLPGFFVIARDDKFEHEYLQYVEPMLEVPEGGFSGR